MGMQGWPLWAVRPETGQVYAVIGWEQRAVPDDPSRPEAGRRAIGVELTPSAGLDQPAAIWLGDGLRYTTVDPTAGPRSHERSWRL
jgi:hypothetical protein